MKIVALLLAALTTAAPPSFEAAKKAALFVDRPVSAVAVIVGDCDKGDAVDQQECRNNLKEAAKKWQGKTVALNLGAGHEKFLKFEGPRGEKVRFVWAPLVDVGEGLALTVGKPQKLSAQGTVVVAQKPMDAVLAEGIVDSDVARAAQLGQIVIEIVGKFGQPWRLGGGEKVAQGVSFELAAVRFTHARTGKTLAEISSF